MLVHGGAGGIGTTAIQLSAALGMRVFTTCSSAENAAYCQNLGAERAINYREEDCVEPVSVNRFNMMGIKLISTFEPVRNASCTIRASGAAAFMFRAI